MGPQYDRLKGHVAAQYERRGRGRERADRLDQLVPAPAEETGEAAAAEPTPATSTEEETAGGD